MNIYLDKLELHGFKSFPEKTIIKFHKGITAIIGPNGCGKSNIVDAVLWVLGEQKIKSLRGENNEDLIFNGSVNKKPLGMTEVGAYFIKNYEPVHIARRYYRSSETKYILNQKYSRNKDIQNALYDMRMGEKKYFIFEQGSIDKLVSLKAGEKRILIEEAAGVSQYLERKKETINKLIIAEQNLENTDMLISDKELRLKELKNQVNYVQRYRSYKLEKIKNLKALINKKYNDLQKEVKKNIVLKNNFTNEESDLSLKIKSAEKELLGLEEIKWNKDIEQKKLENIKFETNGAIISTRKDIEKLKQQKMYSESNRKEIQKNIGRNKEELKQISPKLEKINGELDNLKENFNEEKEKLKEYNAKLAILKKTLEEKKTQKGSFNSKIFKIQSNISYEKNNINGFEKTKFSNDNEIKNKETYLKEIVKTNIDEKLKTEKDKLKSLENDFAKINEEINGIKEIETEIIKDINSKKDKTNEIRNEIISLKKQKEKYLEIKKKIYGRDDNQSPNKPLQEIIITEKDNFKAIENYFYNEMESPFMERNNLPKDINSMILIRDISSKIPTAVRKEISTENGFIDFISNKYELENKTYKNSLKEGIFVDTLENGIDIFLKYGIGIITKNSEIIDMDGVIIRERERGILNVNREISEAEKKIKEYSITLDKLLSVLDIEEEKRTKTEKERLDKQEKAKELEKEIFQKQSSIEMLVNENDRNIKRAETIEKELIIIKNDNREIIKKIEESKEKLQEFKGEEKDLLKENQNFQDEIEKKREEIDEIYKAQLQKQNMVNLLKERINSLEIQILNLHENEKRLQERNKVNIDKINQILSQNEDIKKKLIELQDKLKFYSDKSSNNEKLLIENETKLNGINEKIKENNTVLGNYRESLNKLREERGLIEITLSSFKKDIFQLEDIALRELNDEIRNIKGDEEYLLKDLIDLEKNLNYFDDKLSKMRDSEKLNFSAESEYEFLYKDHGSLILQKDDIIRSIKDMHDVIEKIDNQSKKSFLKAFDEIKKSFVDNFKILFEGGDATLSLTDEENLLETGLDIKAQPPGKQLLSLRLLSGGEKTLTSLAFLFALFQYKPAPFCIFDEVDASLDEANIQRFLKFLHILKENTQFLIITHNFKTMEEADYLYGITMNEPGISTIYSTKFADSKKIVSKQ